MAAVLSLGPFHNVNRRDEACQHLQPSNLNRDVESPRVQLTTNSADVSSERMRCRSGPSEGPRTWAAASGLRRGAKLAPAAPRKRGVCARGLPHWAELQGSSEGVSGPPILFGLSNGTRSLQHR